MTCGVGHEAEEDTQHRGSVGVGRSLRRWRTPQSVDVVTRESHVVALWVAKTTAMGFQSSQKSRYFRSNLPPIDPVSILAASK